MKIGDELFSQLFLRLRIARRRATRQVVVTAERKDTDGVASTEFPTAACLVVPVTDLYVVGRERQDGSWVPVTARDQRAASPVSERRLEERARVYHAQVCLAVKSRRGLSGLAGDDRARIAAVLRRSRARKKIDMIDEPRMNHALPDLQVEQERHSDAIDEIAGVVRRCAAHVKIGQTAGERRHTRQGLDGPKSIAECARHLTHVALRQRGLADFPARALHRDFERRLGGWGWCGCCRRGSGRARNRDWRSRRRCHTRRHRIVFVTMKRHARADAGRDRHVPALRGLEAPGQRPSARLLGERLRTLQHLRAENRAVLLDDELRAPPPRRPWRRPDTARRYCSARWVA